MAAAVVRVIAGEARGVRLRSVASGRVRPSGDRLKEGLFSTLGSRIEGNHVLDLYAGSGALGIEALSRGAAHATFVEGYQEAVEMIKANLEKTALAERATVIRSSVGNFVEKGRGGPFDVVFLDPPYAEGIPEGLLAALSARGLINDQSLVVLETSSRTDRSKLPAGYRLRAHRRYGDSTLLYLELDGKAS